MDRRGLRPRDDEGGGLAMTRGPSLRAQRGNPSCPSLRAQRGNPPSPSLRAQRGNPFALTQSKSWIATAFGLAMTAGGVAAR